MDEQDQEIIREFVLESNENLGRLDQEIVALESTPRDATLLASVFRTMHTLKGTCGFLGFSAMESVAHHAENILSQLRAGKRVLDPNLTTVILAAVDMIRGELASVEDTGHETGQEYPDLLLRLRQADEQCAAANARDANNGTPPASPTLEDAVDFRIASATTALDSSSRDAAPLNDQPSPAVAAQDAEVLADALRPPDSAEASHAAAFPQGKTSTPPYKEEEDDSSSAQGKPRGVADSAIRVDVMLLDKLMNLVGELVLARNQVLQFTGGQEDAALNAASQRLDLITTELQEGVMKTRMQPIGVVWGKLPRVVRDLASSCHKQIRLEMDGAETELDKTIIEAINDPLTHIVRNSCDHGIEEPAQRLAAGKPAQGKLGLRAFHEGGHVNIEISDDGRGIDPERVRQRAIDRGMFSAEAANRMTERDLFQLIFAPGFSTAEKVSSISGRGVGMDVVRTNIEKIGGSVDVSSVTGMGTTVRLKIPLTLAIIPGLVITHQKDHYVIPQVSLLELIRLEGESGIRQIERVHGTPVYRRRGNLLPLAFLTDIFQMGLSAGKPHRSGLASGGDINSRRSDSRRSDAINIVVLQAESHQFGLVVDGINDTQEIVVKPLGKQLKRLTCYAGATIMGDGKVALILDVMGIGQLSGVLSHANSATDTVSESVQVVDDRQNFLLFSAGSHQRLAVPLALVARLEEFPTEDIECAAGRQVIQYRGQILPLISLTELLDSTAPDLHGDSRSVRVVVFSEGPRSVGVWVDQILDIVEGDLRTSKPSSKPGILASFVLGGKITDLIDLKRILAQDGVNWFTPESASAGFGSKVLVAEPENFRRNLLRTTLQLAGYRVKEARSTAETLRILDQDTVDVALISVSLPPHDGKPIHTWIREHRTARAWSTVAIVDSQAPDNLPDDLKHSFDAWESAFDHHAMLKSIEHLRARANGNLASPKELLSVC